MTNQDGKDRPSKTSLPVLGQPLRPANTLSTIAEGGKREWQYPTWFRGKLLSLRTAMHWFLVGILLLGPWIDIGGNPAVFIDIPERRAYIMGLKFFATDGSYLLFVFGITIFSIFLFTALFGRAWCGWTCPQTVFMESVIRPIERLIEGKASARRKLDRAPWTSHKIFKKALKYACYAVICGAIGTTAVAYFLGREGVMQAQANPLAHPAGTAIFLFVSALCFFDFAWFREQTCLVVCPYGRFQSVLLDHDSIGVGYDVARGEPRGKPRKKKDADAPPKGDCVDCKRCVNVCPTGIDIRNGNQLECIQCMACIDACDDMMNKLKRPTGLIRLDSERVLNGGKRKLARPRVFLYAGILTFIISAFVFTLGKRTTYELHLGRQGTAPYTESADGRLQNALLLRISNKSSQPQEFDVSLQEAKGLELYSPLLPFKVGANDVAHLPVFVLFDKTQTTTRDVSLRVHTTDDAFEQVMRIQLFTPNTNLLPPQTP